MSQDLTALIAEVFGMKQAEITDSLTMNDVEAWDSLKHMELVVAIEQAMGIELTFEEIVSMKGVREIKDVLTNAEHCSNMDLVDKKVIVTGGVRGLGRSIVEKLVSRHAAVAVFDNDIQGLDLLSAQLPGVRPYMCDVSSYDQVSETMARYHQECGVPDVLVNNAGILYSAPLVRITEAGVVEHDIDAWQKVLKTDLDSVFYVTACVVEKMIAARVKGVVVNISSVSASGNAGQSAYSAAKAGVNALTAVWAKELGPLGLRVVAVAPGYADTESTAHAMTESALRDIVRKIPVRRLGKPSEIADGVLSVIENDFFNGKVLELDGGLVV